MDLARFGLGRRPFRPFPAAELYFSSAAHAAAADRLRAAFAAGDGLAVLTGDPGTGKTATALRVLEMLGREATPVMIPTARFDRPADFYRAVLADLGLPAEDRTAADARLALTEFALKELAAGRRTALVLDDADGLGPDVLPELRALDNLAGPAGRAVFTLVVGSPAVKDSLAEAGLAQRVGCHVRLLPLPGHEAAAFLRHQLRVCGGNPDQVFTDEAIETVVESAGGLPRVLNRLAHAALAAAAAAGHAAVDAEAVYDAAEQLGLLSAESDESDDAGAGESGEPDEPGLADRPKQLALDRRAA